MSTDMGIAGSWSVLRAPAFRQLFLGTTASRLGGVIAPIALAFAVLDLGGSATTLGLVVGARTVANVVLLLFGGVVADRLPRGLVLVGSSLAAAVTQGVLAGLIATRTDALWLVIVLSACNGAAAAFALPASSALIPATVSPEQLVPANAISRLGANASAVVGTSFAGLIVASLGSAWGIGIDALTYVVAAGFFVRIPRRLAPQPALSPTSGPADVPLTTSLPTAVPEAENDDGTSRPSERSSVVRDLVEGWHGFRTRQWLWVIVVAASVLNAVETGAIAVLGPVFADDGIGRTAWGLVLAGQTIGFVVGGLAALRLRPRRLLLAAMLWVGVWVLPLIAMAADTGAVVLFLAFFLAGFGLEQFGVSWQVAMQQQIPPGLLARVSSYDMLGSFVAVPVGEIAAGPIAHAAGLTPTLAGGAAVMVVVTAASLLSPQVRQLRSKTGESPPAVELA